MTKLTYTPSCSEFLQTARSHLISIEGAGSIAVRRNGAKLRQLTRCLQRMMLVGMLAVVFSGCAQRTWNNKIDHPAAGQGYDLRNRLPENSEEQFVVLAFSGGGTRAAAFSYGVLKALRDTNVTLEGESRRLLDEVDVISSVSGGSYTAAYYGLFGDRIFEDFTPDFLYRNWQGRLISLALRPRSLVALTSGAYNRSDLIADHLDDTLFEQSSFDDMSRNNLPFVIVNASDINNATTFSFIQQHFDFLCSDLSSYPVANAVMASSSVPGPFATIALRNYEGCSERNQPWVADALQNDNYLARRHRVAAALERYSHPDKMPILRLVDGGVTDNLGLRGSMMSPIAQLGRVQDMAGAFTPEQLQRVRNVLVVVVNAQVYQEKGWSLTGHEPGLASMINASFDAALGILNTETVAIAKREFLMWQDIVNTKRAPDEPKVKVNFVVLTFEQVVDDAVRARLNGMPTTFRLGPDQVDELITESGKLLRQSSEYKNFLEQLNQAKEVEANIQTDSKADL